MGLSFPTLAVPSFFMKWKSRLYNHCFCYERNGVVYTSVNGDRKSTSMKWKNDNKDLALKIAEQRFRDQYETKKTIQDLQELFNEIHIKKLKHHRKLFTLNALRHLLKKNYPLRDVQGIRKHLLENIKKSNLSRNTLSAYMGIVKHLFRVAVDNDMMDKNPVTKSINIRPSYKTKHFLTDTQLVDIIDKFEDPLMKDLIKFISLTGLRINEALSIRAEDIHEDHFLIRGKGDRDRVFPLEAIPEAKEYVKVYNIKYSTALFKLKKSLRANGLDNKTIGFHIIRKYAINSYIRNGLSINVASEIFGHKIAVMEKHYLEIMDSKDLNEITKKQLSSAQKLHKDNKKPL